ncbi:MAG: [FeFe] hydrogenase H-cluster radical SAM maturase HydE [Oscillibacter sp.]|nr:[FeFe] hydrogenase H-cluster radical SAM maturase HydE [Oscillibacter sp.]
MIRITDKQELIHYLNCTGEEEEKLFQYAAQLRKQYVGNKVYLRGLIEFSNICRKNCLYCGIRRENSALSRYELSDQEVLTAAQYAWQGKYGSIVIQSGERTDRAFVLRIETLIKKIKQLTNNGLGITLSLGEQSAETYRRWLDAGAHRYLLRIETSNESLYKKIHPNDSLHVFSTRLKCLEYLQKCGYKTGSGVMIGLPFQTTEDLADDLLFLKNIHIDMVGMGPYLEHESTPLYAYRQSLLPLSERLRLDIHMVACLRILMPHINIAATTALQAIDPLGREKAITAGANVMMPNITPINNRRNYKLYQNKPCTEESTEAALRQVAENLTACQCSIAWNEWGDPLKTDKSNNSTPLEEAMI